MPLAADLLVALLLSLLAESLLAGFLSALGAFLLEAALPAGLAAGLLEASLLAGLAAGLLVASPLALALPVAAVVMVLLRHFYQQYRDSAAYGHAPVAADVSEDVESNEVEQKQVLKVERSIAKLFETRC